jgi:hypothetical protein
MHTFEIGQPDAHVHAPIDMSGMPAQDAAQVPPQHTSFAAHVVEPHTH